MLLKNIFIHQLFYLIVCKVYLSCLCCVKVMSLEYKHIVLSTFLSTYIHICSFSYIKMPTGQVSPEDNIIILYGIQLKTQNMSFKSFIDNLTVIALMEKFFSQIYTLKNALLEKKLNCWTCTERCQITFKVLFFQGICICCLCKVMKLMNIKIYCISIIN